MNLAGIDLEKTAASLRGNGFEAWRAGSRLEARRLFWEEIFKKTGPRVVSWGDSLTLHALDLLPELRQNPQLELIETFGAHLTWREAIYNRKKALSCDLFLTGTNAVTARGQLVNLDMIGNRVAGIAFGPRHVVVFAGINKIVENVEEAINRIRTVAAPLNAKRHGELKTPCQAMGECMDCKSPQRICNTWMITEKSYPAGRVKVVLIDEALGY